jgi:hypothetical protein
MSQLCPRDLLANGRVQVFAIIAKVAKADIEEMAETVDAGFDRDALVAQFRSIRECGNMAGSAPPPGRVLRDVVGEPRGD